MVNSLKSLVSAQTIQQIHKDGLLVFSCPTGRYIVTPEARDEARKLGIKLIEGQEKHKVDCLCTGRVKLINGSALTMAKIKDTGNSKIGLIDLVGTQDSQTIAAGLMVLENSFMSCSMDYAEIDVILAGELHVCCEEETVVAKTGDTVFIPHGLDVQVGTPTSVRFIYITCKTVDV